MYILKTCTKYLTYVHNFDMFNNNEHIDIMYKK